MVSPKVPAKPQSPTMEKKIKSLWKSFKSPKDKNKEKAREKEIEDKQNALKAAPTAPKNDKMESIMKTFENLQINTNKTKEQKETEDEFTFKVIEDDRRSEISRINSNTSADSGIDVKDDVADILEKLAISEPAKEKEDKGKKEKKVRDIVIERGPTRSRVSDYNTHPYASRVEEHSLRQINQINTQILSGGHLIVHPKTQDNLSEIEEALTNAAQTNQDYRTDHTSSEYLKDVLEVLEQDEIQTVLAVLEKNFDQNPEFAKVKQSNDFSSHKQYFEPIPNPIEEFSQHITAPTSDEALEFTNFFEFQELGPQGGQDASIFLTPPRSETVSSPMSESHHIYPSNSEYTLSPERSSPDTLDLEKYQEISPMIEKRERASSISSMTMKNYKDLQKEIANELSKKNCCDIERKTCAELFEVHLQKLEIEERRNLVLNVAKMDLKMAYGVLHHSLVALSRECVTEDLHICLVALIANRVLAQNPTLFLEDFGLSILKAAALRCPQRPLLTRFIVECVYKVLRNEPKLCAKDCVFHEVDAQGDNLVIACARAGDAYALVLSEIARSDLRTDTPPLFRLNHTNNDGYTALHVACRQHGTSHSHLHVVHVLLQHAQADIWKGDIKGGDTAVHLAVNSASCDTALVMLLFKQVDRKEWKKLAHSHNMSSATPLEYARKATNSTARLNYPHEVLEFLKKCR